MPKVKFKNYILFFGLIVFTVRGISQSDTSTLEKNEFNIELLGSIVWYSFNYERLLHAKNKIEYKLSTGLHFNPFRFESLFIEYRTIGINIEPKLAYDINRNSIIFGIGYTYIYLFDNLQKHIFGCCADLNLLIPRLGYRRYLRSNSRYFGISFNPIFVLDLNEEGDEWSNNFFIPYGGIQYGWKF